MSILYRMSRGLVWFSMFCGLLSLFGCGTTFFAAVEDKAGLPVDHARVLISTPRMLDVFQLKAGWGMTDERGVTESMTIERFQIGSRVTIDVRDTSGAHWRGTFQVEALPLETTPVKLRPFYYGIQTDENDRGCLHVLVWSRGAKRDIE